MSKFLTPLAIYLCATLFITTWWTLAWLSFPSQSTHAAVEDAPTILGPNLRRSDLQKALGGDYGLMVDLIEAWESEPSALQKGKMLLAEIRDRHDGNSPPATPIYDDLGIKIERRHFNHRYLPQTYMAAAILLALLEPEQITALPKGMRLEEDLFGREVTKKIPLDTHHLSQEKLFLSPPDVAFIANYSNPATIAAFKAQNIPLFTVKNIQRIGEIQSAISRLGQLALKRCEAELLNLFMNAALNCIDKHLLMLKNAQGSSPWPKKILYLSFFGQFSQPAAQSLTGELLDRLEKTTQCQMTLQSSAKSHHYWMTPVSLEMIANFDPDGIIVAAPGLRNRQHDGGLIVREHSLNHFCDQESLFIVDNAIQHSPSQYLVLAYFDLASALSTISLRLDLKKTQAADVSLKGFDKHFQEG